VSEGALKQMIVSRFPEDIKSKFKMFLRNNWVGSTPEELAFAWNIQSFKYQADEMRVRNALNEMGVGISSNEIDRIRGLRASESEIMSSNNPMVIEKIKAERVKLMRSRLEDRKDIWTGLDSEEEAQDKISADNKYI
jgi:hypothetical protein